MWYSRFEAFRLLGPGRSLLETVNQWRDSKGQKRTNNAPATWRRAHTQWHWKARAEAWDLDELAKRRALWEKRAEERRDAEWRTASRLQERADQMLMFPVARTVTNTSPDGLTQTVIEPTEWKPTDVVRYAETASKLGRLAAGLETDRIGLSLNDVLRALPEDFRAAVRAALAGEVSGEPDPADATDSGHD